jgi:hypothetical protein
VSPVEKGFRPSVRTTLLVAVGGVVAGLLLFALVLWLVGRGDEVDGFEVRLGDDQFGDVQAERTAERIADEGPIIFGDPAKGERPIYLQHLGELDEQGWYAFDAIAPGCDRSLLWKTEDEIFVDPCTDEEFLADGTGLPAYPAEVNEDGQVIVDLNAAFRTPTTS